MSEHPVEEFRPAHKLGQDNEDIYCGLLGLSKEKLEQLKANKDI